jgi:hypothetical protein
LIDFNPPFSHIIWRVSPDGLGIPLLANCLVHGAQKHWLLGGANRTPRARRCAETAFSSKA